MANPTLTITTPEGTRLLLLDSRYESTVNGGVRLASKPNPSPYADNANPDRTVSENLRREGRRLDLDLATFAAIAASESKEKGEGHARESREYRLSPTFVVPTPVIRSAEEYRAWLVTMAGKPSMEDSEYALWIVCKQACLNDVRNLRVIQRDMHESVAEEAASMASLALLTAESTLRVMGEHKGETLLNASLLNGKGEFPVMRMVGFECQNATQTVLKDKGITFTQAWGEEYATRQDYATMDSEEESTVNGWIRSLAEGANTEEARGDEKVTLRRDMWTLYRLLRYNKQIESAEGEKGSTAGHKNRDKVAESLGWSRAKYARTMMELRISRAYWFKTSEEAASEEATLREAYRVGFIGDKKQQAANKAAKVAA